RARSRLRAQYGHRRSRVPPQSERGGASCRRAAAGPGCRRDGRGGQALSRARLRPGRFAHGHPRGRPSTGAARARGSDSIRRSGARQWRQARRGLADRVSRRSRLDSHRGRLGDCMAEADTSTLGALTAPHSAVEFLRDYWPDKAFAAHGDPARLPAFLRASELDSVEALSRVYRGNLRFTSGRRYQKMLAIDQVHATSLYRMGLTVQFEDISPFVATTAPDLRRLEAELGVAGGAARASVFASPFSDGLSVHFDAQDLFSIQLKGTKRFRIAPVRELRYPVGTQFVPDTEPFDFLYPQVPGGFPDPAGADFTTVEMQPGSVLFLPRGTWHTTESGGDSLSVSIGLYLPSAADCVLEQLQLLLLQDPEWRCPLYGGWGDGAARDAVAARLSRLLARLPRECSALKVEDVLSGL